MEASKKRRPYFMSAATWITTAACLVASAAILSVLPIVLVPYKAEMLAAGRPYCIQLANYPGGTHYQAADDPLDFLVWRMRAREDSRGYYPVFHAVLFVERTNPPEWGEERFLRYNWSYRQFDFRAINGQGHAGLGGHPTCTPN